MNTTRHITHHTAGVNGTELHYVTAGDSGTPVLLIHGFPESWWAFHAVIPLLAQTHRVTAVDLRGWGDSSHADGDYDSATVAEDLHELVIHLGQGPVHLAAQDISGGVAFRVAAAHPGDVLSFTGTETGLAGFGLESLADITHGGSWHIGALTTPGIPELLLAGREREFLGGWAFPAMSAVPGAVTADDITEFTRTFARPGGWRGAVGLYRSMLAEGDEIREIAASSPLRVPALAIGGSGGPFTGTTLDRVTDGPVDSVVLENVGHYVALEAPEAFATALLSFIDGVDDGRSTD